MGGSCESAITAKKEGRRNDILPKSGYACGKTGIGHGGAPPPLLQTWWRCGATAFFILNGLQLIFGAVLIGMAVLMKRRDLCGIFYRPVFADVYSDGRTVPEFERPYIYMAPYRRLRSSSCALWSR